MGFKDLMWDMTVHCFKKEVTTGILLEIMLGRSSELYERLYEQGLIDDRFSFGYEGQKDYGFCIGGETADPKKLHKELTESISNTIKKGINAKDLERVKRNLWESLSGALTL